jgi:hypothetical protein
MTSLRSTFALLGVLALAGGVAQVQAEEQVVTISATRVEESHAACEGRSASESSRVAREAEKSGEYEQAAECFRVAGEYTRAHRASLRAAGEDASALKRNASAGMESAKAQAARLKAAFR